MEILSRYAKIRVSTKKPKMTTFKEETLKIVENLKTKMLSFCIYWID